MIQVFSNSLGEEELAAVREVFKSKWVGAGSRAKALEEGLADMWRVDRSRVLLTNSCTSAIYIALKALGICRGDYVIIPSVCFVACANAVWEYGAYPVFVDVNPNTLMIDIEDVGNVISDKTRALFVLHYGGHPAPMQDLVELCKRHDVWIVEDAANAVCSTYNGMACGTIGDAGVWSFDSMKELVMGDGGALHMKLDRLAWRAKVVRYMGLNPDSASGYSNSKDRWWEYEVLEPSGRFISNDILAAIGIEQLKKLPKFIQRRHDIWDYYQDRLVNLPITLPPDPVGGKSSYYMYWVQTGDRDDLARFLRQHDVYTTFRYFPLHKLEGFKSFVDRSLPNSEFVSEYTLNLPMHQNLSDSDVERITELVKKFYYTNRACRQGDGA